jgi:hypothetical protein
MTDINCPICNRMNNDEAERCWYCQAVLHPGSEDGGENWLDGLRGDGSIQAAEEDAAANSAAGGPEEVPDWLARIRQREQSEHGEQPESTGSSGADGMDWLRDIAGETNGEDQPTPPAQGRDAGEPAPIDNDDSDWLGKLETWQAGGQEEPAPAGAVETQSIPEIPGAAPQEHAIPVPVEPAAATGEGLDWLNEFKNDPSPLEENRPEPVEEPRAVPEPELQVPKNIPTPGAGEASEEPFPTDEPANPTEPSSAEPDWLMDFQTIDPTKDIASQVMPQNEAAASDKPPFSGRDMMNWISKDQQPDAVVEKLEETAAEDASIEPAALPPWLQALRPNKLKRGTSTGTGTVGSGDENPKSPLADIEGALTGDALHQFYTRPQIYANTLKITPEQQNHLERLQNIAGEARWEAQEPPAKRASGSELLRIITSLLMIGGVVFSILTNKTAMAVPTLYPQPVVQTYDIISAQSAEKPVLIAADFDASLYGELRWSSEALLKQLISQDVPIAYLSSTQAGSTLMQQNLASLATDINGYKPADRTINLGYLAGGTVGLQALAADPRAAFPVDANRKAAWEETPLQDIEKISDFGALIVITENADTARYWIEQVKPSLGDTPLLVVISAQSAPMLQPYYDSGQINGYIAGQSDGAAYEKLGGTDGPALTHFSTLQVSLLVVAILIFVGGMISLIVRTPSNDAAGQEKK